MNNQTDVSIKFKNSVTGEEKLKRYSNTLLTIKSVLSGIDIKKTDQIKQAATSTKDVTSQIEKTSEVTDVLGKKLDAAFNVSVIKKFGSALGNTYKNIIKFTNASSDYLENFNLFQVAFDGSYQAAEKFVDKMTDMYGLDESWGIKTVGIFKQLSNAMNLSVEQGTKLSTLLTQMSVDISSLYNIDIDRASSVLQSSLAGQTKPIRGATGGDITQNTLQETLSSLGIDKYVGDLSYAEKRLLIVISLTQQLSEATNDFGRTIESPSNQLRIMDEQFKRLTRSVGNLFLPTLSKILPYLNAVLMVLTDIINLIASALGFDMSDYDFFGSVDESVIDFTDDINGASSAVKNLKQGLRGFDKLNVIRTPSDAGSGAGAGGISPDILDAFNKAYDDYNKKLTEVRMKAKDIAERIEDWLGFTDGSYKNLKLIGAALAVMSGLKIIKLISKIFAGKGIIGKLFGDTLIVSGIKKIGAALGSLIEPIKVLGAKDGLAYIFLNMKSAITKALPTISKASRIIGGLVLTIQGVSKAYKTGAKQFTDNSKKVRRELALGLGEATAGGALIGSIFGPVGAAVGAVAGALASGVSSLIGYDKALTEFAKKDLFGQINISTSQWTEILNQSIAVAGTATERFNTFQQAMTSLAETYTANSSALDLYGYKFGVLQQQISEEDGPKIIEAVNNMASSTSQMIEEHGNYSLQLWGDLFSQMDTLTEEEEKDILATIAQYTEDQKNSIAEAQNNITTTYQNAIDTRGYLTDEEYNYIQEQLKKIRELTNTEMLASQADVEFYKQQFADSNAKLDEESYSNFNKALDKFNDDQLEKIKEEYRLELQEAEWFYKTHNMNEEKNQDIYKKMKKTAYDHELQQEEKLKEQVLGIKDTVYEELANKYKLLEKKTDETSRKQRELIEGIFKNIKIDKSDIVKKFATLGDEVGKSCAVGIRDSFNRQKVKFEFDASNIGGQVAKNGRFTVPVTGRISGYAGGGLPPVGQIFVANERGPEMIGQIGGQSFVANQNQVVDFLDKKLSQAKNTRPQVFNFYLDPDHKLATYTLDKLQDMAISNGKPITIEA